MPEIKERPILFSAPMVRAILEGRKTVTRRAVKFPLIDRDFGCELAGNEIGQSEAHRLCPYGQPEQRLWVRESWWQAGDWQATYPEDDTGAWFGSKRVVYSADGTPPNEPNTSYPNGLRNGAYSAAAPNKIWRHRPSIHMNRWASRILLEINDVRVERLQDITEAQAKAEGVRLYTDHAELGDWWHVEGIETYSADPRKSFELLWSSVGGDWQANPWVWVVEFKRVTP
ncbi:hypothetical protein [Pseudomonas sp. S09G 359]|uniref:hypothetical protein n=1 Tax=Pseudomonas sp. S09G 359 TaxID=2054919 RepID=UPI000C6CEC78|nr:hypothetical protein [Pseudomonas sp. S09G 359]AUG08125.1 hypothetical protein CXQ82_16605 [Pseudomonas sp. S09G 359]